MSTIPNDKDNLKASFEREFILRSFNKHQLAMEVSQGTSINKVIGLGKRANPDTGQLEPVTKFYYSYYRIVLETFEIYPFITEKYGLSIVDVMNLPVNEWYLIRRQLENTKPKEDTEARLIKLIERLIGASGGGE